MQNVLVQAMSFLADAAPAAGGDNAPIGGFASMLPALVAIMVIFYFLILRPENKRSAQQKALREAIKKNDKVLTSGGIYGIVANVQRDANRVTLKVDEATNAKIDVTFDSISTVLTDSPAEKDSK
ncbi:MAG TPA: preprotein translocase subunit YajC [Pirellulales bacterium]|nr:preprotein translocase subunit YajC [Pirellulales bacterium]